MLAALPLMASMALADSTLDARVLRVHDGDTITVQAADGAKLKVRLIGIDTPELHQTCGKRARERLYTLVQGRTVSLQCAKQDRYQRQLCTVYAGQQDINLQLLAEGQAWHYAQSRELSPALHGDYAASERAARAAGLGLWQQDEPLPPWQYRALQRQGRTPPAALHNPCG